MLLVNLKRNRRSGVQDFQILNQDFDLAGRHLGVFRALGAPSHAAAGAEYEFTANTFRCRETLRGVRVDHDLDNPGAIAQVDRADYGPNRIR